ncbi:IclR family transcriptional regulator [Spiractinospora alimapuensis]|uniref:IclR family transcriptional regulator n=1 Tax=Spiractinospora alimapuensis TaxID=2820884 RepID=UPI001F446F68|nr:IclR family transcriptional regulator [Spiractinospora alimapuensis]QVQ52340.1 IclR family transcriptional regulator [Spiractinospora alimapuensis]
MPGPVQSIERAAAILRLLDRGSGQLGVSEIADSLDLARGTTHGILRTLRGVGFVEQDNLTGKYQLGVVLRDLGTSSLDGNELRSLASNWADTLAARSRETVRVGAPGRGHVLVVHHVFRPDDSPQALDVGALLPLHATALGKSLLAGDAHLMAALTHQPLERFTPRTVVDHDALAVTLPAIRRAGWAGEYGEMTLEEASLAAPIRGPGGLVVGAISVSGPVDRICDSRGRHRDALVDQVRAAAHAISRELEAPRP